MATTAKRKPGTATARMHNWTPKGVTRKAANKSRKRTASKSRKRSGKKRGRRNPQSTSTALATRAPQTVVKVVRANGTKAKKNPARRAKRNPSGGGGLSQFRLRGNPSFSDLGSLGRIALVGFGGGLLARTNSAVVLALVRRFGGQQGAAIASHAVVKPITTALAAWFLVPRELRMMGVRSEQSHKVAQVGGILFAAADMVDIFFAGVNTIPDRLAEIVGGTGAVVTNPKTAIAQQAATAAAQSAANAGLSDDDIAAAAQGAYEGTLAGIPQVDDLTIEDSSFLYS